MFNNNKNPNEIRPGGQPQKEQLGVIKNKNVEVPERNQKEDKQSRTDLQSEGGKN